MARRIPVEQDRRLQGTRMRFGSEIGIRPSRIAFHRADGQDRSLGACIRSIGRPARKGRQGCGLGDVILARNPVRQDRILQCQGQGRAGEKAFGCFPAEQDGGQAAGPAVMRFDGMSGLQVAEGLTDHIWSLKELLTSRVPIQ